MGNVYNVRFTNAPINFVKGERNYSIKLKTILSKKVERGGKIAWNPAESFDIVRNMMSKNSIRYVRYSYKRKGELFNQQPERKKEGLQPRKKGLDTSKYGGYNSKTASHFSLVKYNKSSVAIIPVDLMDSEKFLSDISFAKKYAAGQLKEIASETVPENEIIFPLGDRIIKINSMLEIDGFRCNITRKSNKGRTIVVSSACSLVVDNNSYEYLQKVLSFVNKRKQNKNLKLNSYSSINRESNIAVFDLLTSKLSASPFNVLLGKIGKKVSNGREIFIDLELEDQTLALSNVLMLLKTGRSVGCDLKLIRESGEAGVISINSVLSKLKGIKSICIIDQSPTGLYEKRSENLLKL